MSLRDFWYELTDIITSVLPAAFGILWIVVTFWMIADPLVRIAFCNILFR